MINPTTARLVIIAFCIAVPQVAVWQLNRRTDIAAAPAANLDVSALPMQIGDWSGTNVDVDPRLFDRTGALSMVSRSYSDSSGRRATVQLTSYTMAGLMVMPHVPVNCYRAHGWTILKDDWQKDDADRRFRFMAVENAGLRASVVYWYQLGPDIFDNRDGLRLSLQKLRRQGKAWPPLVKVMIQVTDDISAKESKSPVPELDSEIYKWILTNS